MPPTYRLEADLSTAALFGRGLLVGAGKSQGVVHGEPNIGLSVEREGVVLRSADIAAYDDVCGFELPAGAVPVTWYEVLFLDLLGRLVTAPEFPLSPLGLIHLGQVLKQAQVAPVGARLSLRVSLDAVEPNSRGVEARVGMEAFAGANKVFEGVGTFLSRKASAAKKDAREAPAVPAFDRLLQVPADQGRAYARVSRDWNPHHLYPWTARAFGFRRPIAHGMWTLARALACCAPDEVTGAPLTVEARFKKPMLLPARVGFSRRTEGDDLVLEMKDAETGAPHLEARVRKS